MSDGLVSEERIIAADPQELFDIVADPAMHPLIDGSGSVRSAHPGNPDRLSAAARFAMQTRLGAPYKITNTVVVFAEGRRIAWRGRIRTLERLSELARDRMAS